MNTRLLIVIPAYNEEGSIVKTITMLKEKCPEYDYLIVNDGSRDGTERLCKENGFSYVSHKVNLGLAGAVQTGMRFAVQNGYDAVLQFDADGQHRPEYISKMLMALDEGYDVVIGSRFACAKKPHTMRMAGSALIEFFIRICTGARIHDPTSGMRMYRKETVRAMAETINMGPEPDTVAYLIRCGARVAEVQVEMDERTAGTSYLNVWRSIKYMADVCVSILFVMGCRQKISVREVKA